MEVPNRHKKKNPQRVKSTRKNVGQYVYTFKIRNTFISIAKNPEAVKKITEIQLHISLKCLYDKRHHTRSWKPKTQ